MTATNMCYNFVGFTYSPPLEQRDSECLPVSIGVCAAFPSRRASRNSSKSLKETLLDVVANESAIVNFSLLIARVTA